MIASHPLPAFLLIADRFTDPVRAEAVLKAARAGVPWIQLRDHMATEQQFERAAFDLTETLARINPDLLLSINSRLNVALKLSLPGARPVGLHVGWRGPDPIEARRQLRADTPIGVSVHELDQMSSGAADYLIWSPVFPTRSKPGNPGTGLDGLRDAVEAAGGVPCLALGGLTPQNAHTCLAAGAAGIAVLSGIMDDSDPEAAAHSYLELVNKHSKRHDK